MTHGSLFSGIGGFDLAAQRMGWLNKFHCEWNEFGQRVLKFYWPEAESFNDITKTDFKPYANKIDILTGGFPCQPYSLAGKRKGKEDERHLWPQMLRAIREIQPRWVVGENVFGLINWSGGLVFHEVQADLEAEGYEVFPYVLPAAAVNAPHRRDRVWFIAYNSNTRVKGLRREWENPIYESFITPDPGSTRPQGSRIDGQTEEYIGAQRPFEPWPFTNPESQQSERMQPQQREYSQSQQGQSGGDGSGMGNQWVNTNSDSIGGRETIGQREGEPVFNNQEIEADYWQSFPTQSPVCDGDDGLSTRLDGITFSKWRNESIKAGGNAICHQVALQIFDAIQQYEDIHSTLKP